MCLSAGAPADAGLEPRPSDPAPDGLEFLVQSVLERENISPEEVAAGRPAVWLNISVLCL